MNSVLKDPPKLVSDENYETWKRDLQIWRELSTLDKAKHAMAIHLSLSGKARIATSELSLDDLKKDNAVDLLLRKLDDVFLPDKSRRQFAAFNKLHGLRRSFDKGINDFLVEFDHVYYEFVLQGMKLPDSVMAFMLLSSCNFDDSQTQLVMSAIPVVSYESMKSAIRRIFEVGAVCKSNQAASVEPLPVVKSEPTLVSESKEDENALYSRSYGRPSRSSRRGYGRSGGRSRGRGGAGRGYREFNPSTPTGEVSRCVICDSKMHWARDCPHSHENGQKSSIDKISGDDNKGKDNTHFFFVDT